MRSSVVKTVIILVSLITAFAIAINLTGILNNDENQYFYVIIDYYSNWNATVTYSNEIFLKGMGKKEHLFVWPQESEANVTRISIQYESGSTQVPVFVCMADSMKV
ncbi:unnamed protein product [marine sediment metagenome]|uniref:Uncharacterized protein n=1 Tax=marine sediment metagenome TaxID=412755 RepID=X1SJ92_9ZZZZ